MAMLFSAVFVFSANLLLASPLAVSSSGKGYFSRPIVILLLALWVGLIWLMDSLPDYAERKRIRQIEALAASLGFTFRRRPTDEDNDLPIGCYLAGVGLHRKVSNVMEITRTDELDFVLFDYQYKVGKHTANQTIARMRSPLLKLPSFLLFPETIFSKIGVMFGLTDVNFPDSPEFSENYILRGDDEAALRAVFSPALRQALTPLENTTVEGADDVLFIFRTETQIKPEDLVSRIEEDKKILGLFFEAQQQAHAAPS